MILHLIHSLHSSPFSSPSLPLLWIHLSSNFLQRAFRPSHPFHLGRIPPYPPSLSVSSTGAWTASSSSLQLWLPVWIQVWPSKSLGGAELRRSPLVQRAESHGKCSGREGCRAWQEPVGLVVFIVSSSARFSFLVPVLPHSQPRLNPTGSVTVSCSPSMETWA